MSDTSMGFEDLPSPPTQEAEGGETQTVTIEDQIEASLFEEVQKMGEAIPQGTYHFRLDSYNQRATSEGQPYFELHWKCQEEPYTGRIVFDNCPWVLPQDVRDAKDKNNPRFREARTALNNRLIRAKAIMEAASFKPTGAFGFKDFLGTNPELKLTIKLEERKSKAGTGADGKPIYKPSGEMGNKITKYLSLHRPA